MHSQQWSRITLGTACLILWVGCGGPAEDLPETAPVTGKVIHQGEPLSRGTVRFYPENGEKPATGTIKEDSTFTLSTFGENDGAVVGNHTATITAYADDTDGSGLSMKSLIPSKYTVQTQSPLEFEVKEGEENTFEIVLE